MSRWRSLLPFPCAACSPSNKLLAPRSRYGATENLARDLEFSLSRPWYSWQVHFWSITFLTIPSGTVATQPMQRARLCPYTSSPDSSAARLLQSLPARSRLGKLPNPTCLSDVGLGIPSVGVHLNSSFSLAFVFVCDLFQTESEIAEVKRRPPGEASVGSDFRPRHYRRRHQRLRHRARCGGPGQHRFPL